MNLRSDDDSWDLGSSVGVTAVMVAAARARETEAADPLICDPYARVLVLGADPGGWAKLFDPDMQERITPADPQAAAMFANTLGYQAVRTYFFDRFFTEAAAAGIRQMVGGVGGNAGAFGSGGTGSTPGTTGADGAGSINGNRRAPADGKCSSAPSPRCR